MNFFLSFSFLLKHIPAVAAPSLNHTHKNDLRCTLPKFPDKIKSTLLSNRTNILIIMKIKMYLKKNYQL